MCNQKKVARLNGRFVGPFFFKGRTAGKTVGQSIVVGKSWCNQKDSGKTLGKSTGQHFFVGLGPGQSAWLALFLWQNMWH